MRVCVLGAGIVGLASAYALNRAGHDVTVLDRAAAGSGASGGNGCQLSYSYVQPLADPGLWAQLPKLLLSRSSPLKLRPRLDMNQWAWALKFLASCNASASRSSTLQLLDLANESRQAFNAMMRLEKLDCDFSATGKLVLYPDQASFAGANRQMLLQREMGSTQQAVNADQCVEIEPALIHQHRQIAGAIYTPGECAADCQKTCEGLVAVLRSRGVRFLPDTAIQRLLVEAGAVMAARTAQGDIEADQFVMALGAASAPMARTLGISLPVYPLKGYSITVDVAQQRSLAPLVSVTDSARKVVFARIGSRLRIAGMVELAGYGTSITPAQTASLEASTRAVFPGCSDFSDIAPWAGLRPATPNALPLIGRYPKGPRKLLLNTGHGALGFTLAFGSAERIARLLEQA
jgi:D-amino-acid dehydrogenase